MKAGLIRINPFVFNQLMQLPAEAIIVDVSTDIYRHGDLLIKVIGIGEEQIEGQTLREIKGIITRLADGNVVINWEYGV